MENTSKIDIFKTEIVCYNEFYDEKEIFPLTSDYDFFLNEFSDTQDLLTVNIDNPIKRIMKFYKIENSIPESFTEIDYIDMTAGQKDILDQFINLIQNK